MRALEGIRTIFSAFAERFAALRRGSQFDCGDCERKERCGLAPQDDCVVKAEQIARDADKPRPPGGYYTAVWPR